MDRNIRITLTNSTAMVEATFTSNPLHTTVTWTYNNNNLQANDRYTMLLEDFPNRPGQYMTTMAITDLAIEDMGLYTIVVRNDFGVTQRNFLISRGKRLCF